MPSPLNENLAPGLVVREEYGIPVEFACPVPSILEPREAAAVDSDVRTIDVNFSYEFAILDPRESIEEVMEQDLPNLEYGILYLVAKSIGLLKCELQRQNVSSWATDVLTDSTNTEPYIVSLSSGANDQPKTDIGKSYVAIT